MLTADRFIRSGKVRDLYALDDGSAPPRRVRPADARSTSSCRRRSPTRAACSPACRATGSGETDDVVPNHLSDGPGGRPGRGRPPDVADDLRGRMMLCRRATVLPVEVVVRGYLSGSGWKEYRRPAPSVASPLPAGLRESDRLPEPILTPATKAEVGAHDENIDFEAMVRPSSGSSSGPGTSGAARPRRAGPRHRPRPVRRAAGRCAVGRDHPRRHQVRVRPRRRRADPRRRDPDPRFVALLGRGDVRAGRPAGELRQAVRPRLAGGASRGTRPRRGRSCRPTSSPGRGRATSRPSNGSPARASTATSRRT